MMIVLTEHPTNINQFPQIDECGRLWVLDTGKIGSDIICQPQLLAFDLNTVSGLHQA